MNEELSLSFDCPELLGSVILYNDNGTKKYHVLLGKDSNTYDPNYEVLLRAEKKLKNKLVKISFEDNDMKPERLEKVSEYLKYLDQSGGVDFNEMIINKDEKLLGILSRNRKTTSVFLGKHSWNEKTVRLKKSLEYFLDKKTQPSLIKFVDDKKMVVKFSRPL